MANEQNLMPIQEVNSRRSREQHSEDSRKGGIASGEARRKKKAMKEGFELLMSLPLKDEKAKVFLDYLGVPEEEQDNQMGLIFSMYKQAVTFGNVQAATFIRDTMGENPKEKVELSGTVNTVNPLEGLSTEEIRKAIEKMKQDENTE